MKLTQYLPNLVKEPLKALRDETRVAFARKRISHLVQSSRNIRVVIGSGGTVFDGWIPTEKDHLNILIEDEWSRYFNKGSIDAILAEHVWEHLTPEEAVVAAVNCFKFLKSGAYLRVAVPDGNHPNPAYIADVKPGGNGEGADDHIVLYNSESFSNLFSSVGFEVTLLEWFDEMGDFHFLDWKPLDGFIHRSRRFDERNLTVPLTYTSLILDAKKT